MTVICIENSNSKSMRELLMFWNSICRLHKNNESGSCWSTWTVYLIYWL